MPIYEYECTACGHRTEALQKVSDPPLADCPDCGGALKRLLSAPAFQFKGSGWYVTDYAGKGKPDSKAKEKDAGESSSKASDKKTGGEDGGSAGSSKSGD